MKCKHVCFGAKKSMLPARVSDTTTRIAKCEWMATKSLDIALSPLIKMRFSLFLYPLPRPLTRQHSLAPYLSQHHYASHVICAILSTTTHKYFGWLQSQKFTKRQYVFISFAIKQHSSVPSYNEKISNEDSLKWNDQKFAAFDSGQFCNEFLCTRKFRWPNSL